jgi:hypothetical protein
MLSEHCRICKSVVWMVALGQGIRCNHIENSHYASDTVFMRNGKSFPLISEVPECNVRELRGNTNK